MAELTEEQREFWDEIGFPLPRDDEKWESYVYEMQYVFLFDGQGRPSEAALRDEVERRRGDGGGGDDPVPPDGAVGGREAFAAS
jgi:hypothetical protein